MDISCDIIRDLLPLYAEDMVSEDSRRLVDEHLCGCDECTKELGELKKAEIVPVECDLKPLVRLKKAINKRRVLTAVTAVLFLLTLFCGGISFLEVPVWLTAEEAVVYTEQLENGDIRIYLSELVQGVRGGGVTEDNRAPGNQALLCFTTRYKLLKEKWKNRGWEENTHPDKEYLNHATFGNGPANPSNIWYLDTKDGTADILLWNGGEEAPTGPVLPTYSPILRFMIISGILGAVLYAVSLRVKKGVVVRMLRAVGIFWGCTAITSFLVNGVGFVSFFGIVVEYYRWIFITAVPMTLTVICGLELREISRKDKGV